MLIMEVDVGLISCMFTVHGSRTALEARCYAIICALCLY
jgi:hypothetical protein